MGGGESHSLNLDGLIAYPGAFDRTHGLPSYTLLFRSGVIEALRFGGLMTEPDRKIIPSTSIGAFFRAALQMSLNTARSVNIAGPAVAAPGLMTVRDFSFGVGGNWGQTNVADRPDLVLPEIWIEDIEKATDIDELARPMLDIFWQSFGHERCADYDASGVWRPSF